VLPKPGADHEHPGRPDVEAARARYPAVPMELLPGREEENCSAWEMRHEEGKVGEIACPVQQQSHDVAAALQACAEGLPGGSWVVLVEDDTPICPGASHEIARVLGKLSSPPPWQRWRFKTARFSLTFSGTAVPKEGVGLLAARLKEQRAVRPPDHSVSEAWWADRRDFFYPGNLFIHKGEVSAFSIRNTDKFRSQHNQNRFAEKKVICTFAPNDAAVDTAMVSASEPLGRYVEKKPLPTQTSNAASPSSTPSPRP